MKRTVMVVFAGLVVAVAGCSQPYGRGSGMIGPDGMERGGEAGMMEGGHGRGPGMRHGEHGRGMVWNDPALNLTDEQRTKIAGIQAESRHKRWALVEKMHEQRWHSGPPDGQFDEQAARNGFDAMAGLRKQMFDNMLEERQQIDSLLSPQQREQLRMQMQRGGPGGR